MKWLSMILLLITLLVTGCSNEKPKEDEKPVDLSTYPKGVQDGIVSPSLYEDGWSMFEDQTYMKVADQIMEIYKMDEPITENPEEVTRFKEQLDRYEKNMHRMKIQVGNGEKDEELAGILEYGVKIADEEIISLRKYLAKPTDEELSNANSFSLEMNRFNRELSSFFTKNNLFPESMN